MAITFQHGQVVSNATESLKVTLNGITFDIDSDINVRRQLAWIEAMPVFMARSAFEQSLSGDSFADKALLLSDILEGKRFVIYDDTLDNPTPDWMYPVVKGNEVELEYFPTWEKLDSWKHHHEYDFPSAY